MTASPRCQRDKAFQCHTLKERKLRWFFFWKNQILSRLELCTCSSEWPSKHVVGAERLALKGWWFPAPLWETPAARPGSSALLLTGIPGEEGNCVLIFRAVYLGLHAEKGKERGSIANTSRLYVSFDSSSRWAFFGAFTESCGCVGSTSWYPKKVLLAWVSCPHLTR